MDNVIEDSRKIIMDSIDYGVHGKFIPTGLLEPAIEAVGSGKWKIINLQISNKVGKTAGAAAIFANIFWENDKTYFDYPAYKEWPFKDDSGNIVKRARIVGTKENIAESGPINTEIKKWWPSGRYTIKKHGHSYPKEFITDTGWHIDVMSHEQNAKEHEGLFCTLYWVDEPCRPEIIGAITSRFQKGGIAIITNTPIGAGAMLGALDDLEVQGAKIKHIYGSIYDNDSDTGKSNKQGTKKGLMTKAEIIDWVSGILPSQVQARVYGKDTFKSGVIYPKFNITHHVQEFDVTSDLFKKCNLYMTIDPHPRGYSFCQWWAVTPTEDFICWNEWPTYQSLNNNFYDQIRKDVTCPYSPKEIAEFIKLLDLPHFGNKILRRAIDPRAEKTSRTSFTEDTQGLVLKYAEYGLKFELPPFERIATQRDVIEGLFSYDIQQPISMFNRPRMFIAPHCLNTIRSFDRHYWLEGKEIEAETYKDPVDCARYTLALIGDLKYIKPIIQAKEEYIITPKIGDFNKGMRDISLG